MVASLWHQKTLERHSYSFLMVWPTSRLAGGGKEERISRRNRWSLVFGVGPSLVGHDTIILISCPISIGDKCGSMFSRSTEQVGPARLLAATDQDAGQVPGIVHKICAVLRSGVAQAILGQPKSSQNPATSSGGFHFSHLSEERQAQSKT